jgi:hypothetical protein
MGAIKKCTLCDRLFVSRISLACIRCESNNENTSTSPYESDPIKHKIEYVGTPSNPDQISQPDFKKTQKTKKPKAARILQKTTVKKSKKKNPYNELLKEKTSAATHQENIIRKSLVLNYTNTKPTAEPSLGEMIKSAGKFIPKTSSSPDSSIQKYISTCSCQGINQNCFKCNGSGYCERDIIADPSMQNNSPITNSLNSKKHPPKSETSFAADSRGGIYSIRENGRFMSNPIEDDFDN